MLICGFGATIFVAAFLVNTYIFQGYVMAVKTRKLLVAALYDKIAKLSMKSMTETNSGKLITIISADIFQLERAFSLAPYAFASPFINLFAFVLIGFLAGVY